MAWTFANNTFSQTGTDNDFSGLAALSGQGGLTVTTTTVAGQTTTTTHRIYLFNNANTVIRYAGTLTLNPRFETIIIQSSGGNFIQPTENTASFTIGTVNTVNGTTIKSQSAAIIDMDRSTNIWDPDADSLLYLHRGTFVWNEGIIQTARGIMFGGMNDNSNTNYWTTGNDLNAGSIIRSGARLEMANHRAQADPQQFWLSTDNLVIDGLTFHSPYAEDVQIVPFRNPATPPVFIMEGTSGISPHGGGYTTEFFEIRDYSAKGSFRDMNLFNGRCIRATNCDAGSDTKILNHNPGGDGNHLRGLVELRKEWRATFTDNAGAPVSNVRVWMRDTNNGSRLNWTLNSFNQTYTNDFLYTGLSVANGQTEIFDTLTCVGIRTNTTQNTGAIVDNGANFNQINRDFRNENNSRASDTFTMKYRHYSYVCDLMSLNLRGIGVLNNNIILLDDINVTLSEAQAAALTGISIVKATGTASTTNPHRIILTNDNLTLNDVYDFWKQWFCQLANFDTNDQITVDSGKLILGNYRIEVQ